MQSRCYVLDLWGPPMDHLMGSECFEFSQTYHDSPRISFPALLLCIKKTECEDLAVTEMVL